MRERELKPATQRRGKISTRSLPMRERELKRRRWRLGLLGGVSLPMRERELKHCTDGDLTVS